MLYKIFCIDNQAFVALIAKMLKQQLELSTNKFSYAKEQKADIYKPEQILMPVDSFFYSIKKELTAFNTLGDSKAEKIKAEKVS
mgnify:CR=1 FL=1